MSEAIKLAIAALEILRPNICEVAHHAKKDQHGLGEPCPIEVRHEAALAALLAHPDHSGLVKELELMKRYPNVRLASSDAKTLQDAINALARKV